MTLQLPDFSCEYLSRLAVCVCTDDEQFVERIQSPVDLDAQYGNSYWCHLTVGTPKDARSESPKRIHVHFDVVKSFSQRKPPPNSCVEAIYAQIERMHGLSAEGYLQAVYRIPEEQKPKKGMVNAMHGVAFEAAGATLAVTGIEMTIQGEVPFVELAWSIQPNGSLRVTIDAIDQVTIGDNYIVGAERLLRSGLETFILEADGGSADVDG